MTGRSVHDELVFRWVGLGGLVQDFKILGVSERESVYAVGMIDWLLRLGLIGGWSFDHADIIVVIRTS